MSRKCIAIDAMGGDKGPAEVVAAVNLALQALPGLDEIILVGQQDALSPLLEQEGLSEGPRLRIFHAPDIIGMDEKAIQSLKNKKNSSLVKGIELVKEGQAQLLLSCGNTGSLMAGGTIRLRPMEGLERPALCTVWPSQHNHFVLLDAGANPEAEPIHLVHQAILGSHYCRIALDIPQPRVGLLTIGVEEGKGNELVQQSHEMLKKLDGLIHYVGRVEGFDVFGNQADVIVCDGFVGNILLKTCESLFKMMKGFLGEELKKNWVRKTGALLAMPAFLAVKAQLDPERYAGAPLLGLRGHVVKAHGSSSRKALLSALRISLMVIENDMNELVHRDVLIANDRLGIAKS